MINNINSSNPIHTPYREINISYVDSDKASNDIPKESEDNSNTQQNDLYKELNEVPERTENLEQVTKLHKTLNEKSQKSNTFYKRISHLREMINQFPIISKSKEKSREKYHELIATYNIRYKEYLKYRYKICNCWFFSTTCKKKCSEYFTKYFQILLEDFKKKPPNQLVNFESGKPSKIDSKDNYKEASDKYNYIIFLIEEMKKIVNNKESLKNMRRYIKETEGGSRKIYKAKKRKTINARRRRITRKM